MIRRPEKPLDQIGQGGAGHNQEPGTPHSDLAPGKITEPDTSAEVSRQVSPINVQGERGPRAPQLSAAHARRVEIPGIECIEPHEAARYDVGNTHQTENVRDTPHPGIGI